MEILHIGEELHRFYFRLQEITEKKSLYLKGKLILCPNMDLQGIRNLLQKAKKEEEIWFELKENEETLKKYPFAFRLHLGYRLDGRSVEVLWKVENPNEKKMYFSIGGHPAFNCPLKAEEKQSDYQLSFDTDKTLVCSILGETGLLTDRKKEFDY